MRNYILYNSEGTIICTGVSDEHNWDSLASEGQFVLEGIADDKIHRVENGQVVQKPTDQGLSDADRYKYALLDLKGYRTILLEECDWTQIPDVPISSEDKAAWNTYRQTLRDLPSTVQTLSDIENLVWPFSPLGDPEDDE